MVKSNLKEEERVAEEIQRFPCLYDKNNGGYKEKNRKKKKTHGMKSKIPSATKKVRVEL